MVTRLDQLRVEADLDASKYVAGAAAKAAADKRMIDSAKAVDDSISSTQRKLGDSASSVDRLARSLDPAAAAQAKLTSAQNTLSRAVDDGRVSQDRANQLLDLAKQRYGDGSAAAAGYGDAHFAAGRKIEGFREILTLTADAATGNMAGMSRAGALLANTFGLLEFALNPVVLAVAAVGGGFVGLAAMADSANTATRRIGVTLRATGQDAAITTAQFKALVNQMSEAGVPKSAASAALTGALSVPGATAADIGTAAQLAPDFAAAYGTSVGDATKQLTAMGAQGYAAIKKLDEAYNFLTPDQATHIRQLSEAGDKTQAFAAAIDALNAHIKGAASDTMSEFGKTVDGVKKSFGDLWGAIANSAAAQKSLQLLSAAASGIANSIKAPFSQASPTGASPAASLLMQIDELQQPGSQAAALMRAGGGDPKKRIAELQAQYAATQQAYYGQTSQQSAASAAAPPSAAAAPDQNVKAVQDEAAAYRQLAAAQQTDLANRTVAVAKIQAEQEALDKGYSAQAKNLLVIQRTTEARDKLSLAANDNLAKLTAETQGQIKIADAYGISEAAGNAMAAHVKAESDARANSTINIAAQTKAYRDNAAAQAVLAGEKLVVDSAAQLDAQNRLTAAVLAGAEASQEAARQNQVESQFRDKLAAATPATIDQILAEKAAYDANTKSVLLADQARAHLLVTRQAENNTAIAAMKAQAAQITDPTAANAAEMQIARQQEINQLTEQYGTIAQGTGKDLLEMWDKQAASGDQARYWTDVKNQAKSTSDSITQFLVDGFVNVNAGGKSTFESLWDGVLAGAKRLAVQIAATFAEQAIVMPVVMQVVGSTSSLFGIVSPSGGVPGAAPGAAGGGSSGLLGNVMNAGSLLNGSFESPFLANTLGRLAGSIPGLPTSVGTGFVNAGLYAPYGIIGSLAGQMLGFGGNSQVANGLLSGAGGLIGGGIGGAFTLAGMSLGPVGAIAGALLGQYLGKYFGGGKSVGANSSTQIGAAGGQLFVGPSGADNGGNAAQTQAAAAQLVQSVNSLIGSFNLTLANLNAIPGGIGQGAKGAIGNMPQSPDEFVARLISGGVFSSADPVLQTILKNTKASTLDQLASDLQFGQQFEQLAGGANSAAAAIAQVTGQFDTMKTRAQSLGLSLGDVAKAEAKALEDLQTQTRQQLQGLVSQAEGTLGIAALSQFQSGLALSNLSPLSPSGRLAAARAAYGTTLTAAQGGDLTAVAAFPQAAQALLTEGRSFYGSAPGYADLFTQVNQSLNDILAKQRAIEADAIGNLTLVTKESSADIIAAIKKAGADTNAELQSIQSAIRKLTAA